MLQILRWREAALQYKNPKSRQHMGPEDRFKIQLLLSGNDEALDIDMTETEEERAKRQTQELLEEISRA